MPNVCNVSGDDKFVKEFIKILNGIKGITDLLEMESEYIKQLKNLKDLYSEIDNNNFFESIKEVILKPSVKFVTRGNGNLKSILSLNYSGELEVSDLYGVESTLDILSKFDNIDTTSLEKNESEAIKKHFLIQYFPTTSDSRLAFEQKFKGDLVEKLFYNNENRLNLTSEEVDLSIKGIRKELENNLDEFVKEFFPLSYEVFKDFSIENKILYFENALNNGTISISDLELIRIPSFNLITDNKLKNKLNAYMSYISLKHFDEMIMNSFGDSVLILHKGNYNTNNLKYKINLGNKVSRGWSDLNKEVDETEEIGSIIRLFMESLNMYDLNGKLLPFKMSFSDVKSGIGGIMKCFNRNSKEGSKLPLRRYNLNSIRDSLNNIGLERFYGNSFEDIINEYIVDKTLGELVAKTKKDPALLSPLLFAVLGKNYNEFFDRYQEKLAVYSLWRNIFDLNPNTSSLINRMINSGGINIDGLDLYTFINTLFVNIENTPMIEYAKDSDGKTSVIELQLNTSNSRLNSQKFIWQAKYHVEIPLRFKTFSIDDFAKDSNKTTIRINNTDYTIGIQSDNGKVSITGYENIPKQDLFEFLSEVLGNNINQDYLNVLEDCDSSIEELVKIAGTILYNYKVGKYIYSKIKSKDSDKTDKEVYDEEIKTFYSENPPSVARGSILPELTNSSIYPMIRKYSLALDIQQGYSGDTVAKDGSRKLISLIGLSSLASKYHELVYNNNLREDSILKHFKIYDLLEEVEFIRDYALVGNNKQATSFSEAEFFEASFLYDFYGGLLSVDDSGKLDDISKQSKLDLKFRVMGPIISDKSKLPKLRFNWKSKIITLDGNEKYLYELTPEEILKLQEEEFGNYYEAVYTRIHLDLNNLLPFVLRIISNAILDYDNDYKLFNQQCEAAGLTTVDVLHDAIAIYLLEARLNGINPSICLTEKMHYINGKDKKLHNNPSLFHQLSMYGRGVPFKVITNEKYLPNLDIKTINETPKLARRRGNLQLISDLLLKEIRITLGETGVADDNATFAAKRFNKNGWINGRNLIFAKISNEESTINISSINDFKNWKDYLNLLSLFTKETLRNDLNIDSPEFNLSKTLEAINIVRKYNIFRFKESQDALINSDYSNQGQSINILTILKEELKLKHNNWKPETIDKKAEEELKTLSSLDIQTRKAKYKLNLDLTNTILNKINGKQSKFNFNKNLKVVLDYIENNSESLDEEKVNKINSRISEKTFDIEINSELERYHNLNNWLEESYLLTSVGTFIAHPGDNKAKTIYNYEYGNFGQQVKRNVSHTATKHRESQNSLKGIRSKLTIAYIGDEKDSAITYKGDYSKTEIAVHNGATFYNGTMVNLDNNSLGADAMGEDKKPFVHFIDVRTGIGGIIKTAGFAVLNDDIRGSERMSRLNRKMNNTIKWSDTLRRFKYPDSYFDWTKDFNEKSLDFSSGWFVLVNDKFFKFENPTLDLNGILNVSAREVYSNGEPKNTPSYLVKFAYVSPTEFKPLFETSINGEKVTLDLSGTIYDSSQILYNPINSNWELWNVFGGEYSCHFDSNNYLSSVLDNNSFKMVNYVMNHTGKVINPNAPKYSLTNVKLILKESQIDIIPTTEAAKFGATNVNSTRLFDDESYVPTYYECFSDDFGEQLDAEHTAEGGHVSLMTLVINALGARGYSKQDAEECYLALQNLAEQSFEEAFDELYNINYNKTEYSENFKIAIANIMLLTLKNVSISDGNILSAIAGGLKKFNRFGNYSLLEGVFPISSPQIYANLFSKLASNLEKASIRLKFDGGMLVLNPSNGFYKIIDGQIMGKVSKSRVKELLMESWDNPLINSSLIKMGRSYFIISGFGTLVPKLVDSIDDFYEVKNALSNGTKVIEAFYDKLDVNKAQDGSFNVENFNDFNPIGRDLATYDCTIFKLNSEDSYSLWETDIVKLMFAYNEDTGLFNIPKIGTRQLTKLEKYWNEYFGKNNLDIEPLLREELSKHNIFDINPNIMKSLLLDSFLKTLNTISSGIGHSIIIDENIIKIDKNRTTVSPYECILPMIYKTSFGLKENDTIGDIVKDKYFFVKRFHENSKSKFYSENQNGSIVNGNKFDLELKRTDGNHLYLASTKRKVRGFAIDLNNNCEVFGENLYRINPETGKRMYLIPSKIDEKTGLLVANCSIIKTINGTEVIKTDDFSTFLEQSEFNEINFGDFSSYEDVNIVKDILQQLEQSTNKTALNKILYVLKAVTKKVATNKKGLEEGDRFYLDSIGRDENLVKGYQNTTGEYKTIQDIFEDKNAGLNALMYHTLWKNDASNLLLLLDELILSINDNIKREAFLTEHPHMRNIVSFGEKQYNSFLDSIESVVSRTPAQCHLSFMAMRVAAFDTNITNSIYVSRMQLYLLGSDYDIDKANVLGIKAFNGILTTWSPYYDLNDTLRSKDSEKLPFPSGRSLLINENLNKIPFDVIEKNYQKIPIVNGFAVVDNNRNTILAINDNGVWKLELHLNEDGLNPNTYLLQHAIIKNLKNLPLDPSGVLDENVFKFDESRTYVGIDNKEDLRFYLSLFDLTTTNGRFNNLLHIGELIRTLIKLKEIPSEFKQYKDIVDKHNTYFLGKDGKRDKRKDNKKRNALYNFISIKSKNITKDPINLILGQSGIDVATEIIKEIVKKEGFNRLSAIPTTSDNRSILTRMHLLILTLTGKLNVGIVASAMKVFEAMSHHYNKVLSEGTEEEQLRLISRIKILGKELSLIANSYTKNKDTLQNSNIESAYDKVNNYKDAFIMMSALLSLATDNAKDPTLSKLNATPQTIGCYTAGLVLGLSIEDVAKLLISDTGLLLTKIMQSNVFHSKKNSPKNLSSAIRYLTTVPTEINRDFSKYYKLFGIDEKATLDSILWSKRGRRKFKLMAYYLTHSGEFLFEKDINKIAKRNLRELKSDPHYWTWNEEKLLEYENSSGRRKDLLEKKYDEYKRLKELIESYEAYIENPESYKGEDAKKEIEADLKVALEASKENSRKEAKAFTDVSESEVRDYLYSIYDWISYREVVENDKITSDGKEYSILSEIRKLNTFNEEMGDLRTVLKLNQGLPNSVQDLLSWINSFSGTLERASKRFRGQIKENSPLEYFKETYGSLNLDLNLFLNDAKYLLDAINAYESVKTGVNILDVMVGVPHYTGYMKVMNLLYEGGKAVSKNYNTQALLVKYILPLLHLKTPEQTEKFFKTLNPVIFNRVNNNFLWQQQIEYQIPMFKIINGEIIESKNEDGSYKYENIRLGTEAGNLKFKDYCVHYVYPYLKENYPDNAFVKAITLRTYGFNLNHLVSINIAKILSYNMTNPTENTLFNEIKKALSELNGIKKGNIINSLFYYNLIAYNGLPGNLSLTDLFEDFIIYDNNEAISDYNKYITYLDESNILLFDLNSENEYLLLVLAPTLYFNDVTPDMKYFWVINPENNKEVLIQKLGELSPDEREALEALLESSGENYNYDDDYYQQQPYKVSYKKLSDIIDKLGGSEKYLEVGIAKFNPNNRILLGKESIINPELLFDNFKLENPNKSLPELTKLDKNKFLKKHSKNILLSINNQLISLLKFIDNVKENGGWTQEDVFEGFLFVLRKSRDHTYDIIKYNTLKHRLEFLLNNKNEQC